MHTITSLRLTMLLLAIGLPSTRGRADEPSDQLTRRNVEGWTVVIGADLLPDEHREVREKALVALANHLQRIKYIVAEDRLEQLMKLPIWLDREHKLGSMQYHPDRG